MMHFFSRKQNLEDILDWKKVDDQILSIQYIDAFQY